VNHIEILLHRAEKRLDAKCFAGHLEIATAKAASGLFERPASRGAGAPAQRKRLRSLPKD